MSRPPRHLETPSAYPGPVLAVRFADDPFAPEAAVKAITGKFQRARLTETRLTVEQLGDKADHFRWARQAAAVAGVIGDWVEEPAPG